MQAVVPAAGEGTRLEPLTTNQPKGLVEVSGKALLTHVFETLVDLAVSEIVVIVGYRGDDIREQYGDAFDGVPITYARQSEQRGLAHALLQAEPYVEGEFVVLNGDNVCRANLTAVVDRHRETEADATLLIERVSRERAKQSGVVDQNDGAVDGLVEKPENPPSKFVTRGFFAFSEAIFPACRLVTPGQTGERELTEAIDLLVTAGRRVETIRLSGWCRNVNTATDIEWVETRLRSGDR